jgi:hypothetical protein
LSKEVPVTTKTKRILLAEDEVTLRDFIVG